jgi:hypothetical protein
MSQWRRIAIEEVPSCKNMIEQAKNPVALWFDLYSELKHFYAQQPPDKDSIRQIYKFAVWAANSRKSSLYLYLTDEVWVFFENLVVECGRGISAEMAQDLPIQLPSSLFMREVENFSYLLTDEEVRAARKVYSAASHKPR